MEGVSFSGPEASRLPHREPLAQVQLESCQRVELKDGPAVLVSTLFVVELASRFLQGLFIKIPDHPVPRVPVFLVFLEGVKGAVGEGRPAAALCLVRGLLPREPLGIAVEALG